MANSYVEYSSGLTATTYSIPFNYIAIADVGVKGYNGSTWSDLTVASRDNAAKTVTLSAAPSSFTKIRVWRNTSTTQLVDFQNGSRLSESDLDTAYQQGLFVAQEVSEGASTATATGTVDVSLSGNTTVADLNVTGNLDVTGNTTGLDVNGTDIILDADGDSKIEASTDDVVAIHTGGSERLRVTDSQTVLVGATTKLTNASTLELHGSENYFIQRNTGAPTGQYWRHEVDANNTLYILNNVSVGLYVPSGSTGWSSLSDETLKENITDVGDVLDKVKNYRTSRFNWVGGHPEDTRIGFIAQDWATDFPEVVSQSKDDKLGLNYTETSPVLLKAIQELLAKIEVLETKVEALEA